MNVFSKWLTVPSSNETKQIEVVQMWEVRWWSRAGMWSDRADLVSASPELECFTSEGEAKEFQTALEQAFALLRYTGGGTRVELTKARTA